MEKCNFLSSGMRTQRRYSQSGNSYTTVVQRQTSNGRWRKV